MKMRMMAVGLATLSIVFTPAPLAAAEPSKSVLKDIDTIFEQWRLDSHVPGLVYGIVADGRLVAVKTLGVQDVASNKPVTDDSLFRIASMTKAFTALAILKLRDEGKISLDAPAETYVPEMRGWTYPTKDSRKIRVRDLLNHGAGFVTDDPWGDRHQPLPEAEFTEILKQGVPFARPAGMKMEYSNFGYATLGRIIRNVSGKPFQDYIRDTILKPLGMTSTRYDISKSPADRRALGYRWQDNGWVREPDMADGVFGAMGGIETDAKDYARWVAFLLSAWPPRDEPDSGPVARATVREIVQGSNLVQAIMRAPAIGAPCRQARTYGMGWRVVDDCDLGRVLTHGGGYPGYGSNVLLIPDKGLGIFVFTNRTYAGPAVPAFKAALALNSSGDFPDRAISPSKAITQGYQIARKIWEAGTVSVATNSLAMNFLMDRDVPHWQSRLAALKAEVGNCPAAETVAALSAMEGKFSWACQHGRIEGGFLLAPSQELGLQTLELEVAKP